jgi:Mce-associated membrane protein
MRKRNDAANVLDGVPVTEDEPDDRQDLSATDGVDVDDVDPETDDATSADSAAENPESVSAGESRRFGPRFRRIARATGRAAVVLIFITALSASGYLGWQLKERIAQAEAAQSALNAAREYAVILSSVDANDIDSNFAQVLDGATGAFKDMYSQSSAQLRQLLIDNKAVSNGIVVEAGVKSASTSTVEVLLFIDQSVSNAAVQEPRIDRLRMVMTMQKVDGRWLASDVEIT